MNLTIHSIDSIRHRKDEYFPLFYDEWTIGEQDLAFHEELLTYTNGLLVLPRFYVAQVDGKLVGCYALLLNDINSRQDLFPWFAYLYVMPEYRGKGVASKLIQHGIETAKQLQFDALYLETNIEGMYEKYGYVSIGSASDPFGGKAKIYKKLL
mgnify:CR=1 FL=1